MRPATRQLAKNPPATEAWPRCNPEYRAQTESFTASLGVPGWSGESWPLRVWPLQYLRWIHHTLALDMS